MGKNESVARHSSCVVPSMQSSRGGGLKKKYVCYRGQRNLGGSGKERKAFAELD